MIFPVLSSVTTVPKGTLMYKCFAHLPCIPFIPPFSPFSALNMERNLKSKSVDSPSSATKYISPPLPPSPPAGPPLSTYFSRRQATIPLPPLPETSFIFVLSINCILFN